MSTTVELESAFDAAITQARKCIKDRMTAVGGEAAGPYLRKLEEELKRERGRALKRGAVDREWFQKTLRWLVEWVPETELTLVDRPRSHRSRYSDRSILDSSGLYIRRVRCYEPADGQSFYTGLRRTS